MSDQFDQNEWKVKTNPVVFWAIGDACEDLKHETPDDAVSDWLEGCDPDVIPEKLEVVGYARVTPKLRPKESLDRLLEFLDEEYGDPDGFGTEPTEKMLEAEKVFHQAVLAEYECWACEPVEWRTVNVKEWQAEHET